MKITFIKSSTKTKESRNINFIDKIEDSVNEKHGLFYFIDQKDNKFKCCKIENIIEEETDYVINQLTK